MRLQTTIFAATICSALSTSAIAQKLSFRCEIAEVRVQTDDGNLIPAEETGSAAEGYLGGKFEVSLETGRIVGGPFLDWSNVDTEMFKTGGPEWSFVSEDRMADWVEHLRIRGWVKGEEKPFLAVDAAGDIYTGTCH